MIDADVDLRNEHLFLNLQIHNAGNLRQPCAQVFRLRAKHVEIVAKHFERDLRAHARQHVIEPVRNRLADIDGGWQSAETLAYVSDNHVLVAPAGLQIDVDLGGVNAFCMFVQLRATRATAHRLHLRHLQNKLLGDQPGAMAFGQRDAGVEQHADRERALVERRQKRARQERRADCGCDDGGASQRQQKFWMGERAQQSPPVHVFQPAHEPALAVVQTLQAGQHVIGHHRRERDGDDEAGQNRDDIGLPQRRKQTPLNARQRKQRHEHQHDNHGRVDDA